MLSLGRNAKAVMSAFAAVFAMLFIVTHAMAETSTPTSPMVMDATAPCNDMRDEGKASCTPHCAVLCQAILIEPIVVVRSIKRSKATYKQTDEVLTGLVLDQDDPPPRSFIR